METNLRPMALGEILDRTAQLYRENFLLFAGISAVYAGVLLVLSLVQIGVQELLRVEHLTRQLAWATGIGILVLWTAIFIFGGLAVAANNRAVAWVHLGERATIRGAYSSILPRLGRYLWLMTITAFRVWLPCALLYGGYIAFVLLYIRPKGILTHHLPRKTPRPCLFLRSSPLALECCFWPLSCMPCSWVCATPWRCRPAWWRNCKPPRRSAAASH